MTHCYLFWANGLHDTEVCLEGVSPFWRVECNAPDSHLITYMKKINAIWLSLAGLLQLDKNLNYIHRYQSTGWCFYSSWEIRFAWAKVMILSEPEHTACLFKVNLSDKRELEIPNYKHSLLAPSSSRDHYALNQKWGRSSLLSSCPHVSDYLLNNSSWSTLGKNVFQNPLQMAEQPCGTHTAVKSIHCSLWWLWLFSALLKLFYPKLDTQCSQPKHFKFKVLS